MEPSVPDSADDHPADPPAMPAGPASSSPGCTPWTTAAASPARSTSAWSTGASPGSARGLRPARDQRRLDGHGLWLLPGVFDCHLHAGLASFDQLELMRTPISRRVLETAHTLRRTLAAGVTFVRDAGIADAGVRDAVAAAWCPVPSCRCRWSRWGPPAATATGSWLDRGRRARWTTCCRTTPDG